MAKSDGSVILDTRINTDGFDKGMKTVKSKVGGLIGSVGKLGVAIGAAFAVKTLVNFSKEAIELGSNLQEVQNVVDTTFTKMAGNVNEFAKDAAKSAGLSETMAKKYIGTYGAMSKAFGFAEEQAYTMSTTLTQLSGDVASFYNITQDEAYTKLKSVFTGETESLKDLGIVMTQTALDSFAMAKGYGKTTKQMSEQEKVALRYAFVLEQLSSVQGDFVKTSDSWANQTKILSLNFDSFKANIGQALINIFTPFLKIINEIVAKMAEFSKGFVTFSEMLVGKSTSGGGGSPGAALGEIAGKYDDIANSTNEATKAQKKYLSGLDEIKTFSESQMSTEQGITSNELHIVGGNANNSQYADTIGLLDRLKNKVQELSEKYPLLGKIIDVYTEKINPTIKNIKNDFSDISSKFIDWIKKDGVPVLERWGEKFAVVWDEDIRPTFFQFIDSIGGISEAINELWKNDLDPFLNWIIEKFIPKLTPRIELSGNKFFDLISYISKLFKGLIEELEGFLIFFMGTFSGDLKLSMEGLKKFFQGMLNIGITMFEKFLNSMINKTNGLANKINFFSNILGLPSIPTIPNIKIPRLATGAVIPPNAPFMAVLGDQKNGTNIEAPLDTIKQAVREVVGAGNNGGNYHFTAQINRRILFEEFIEEAKLRQSITGKSPFELT